MHHKGCSELHFAPLRVQNCTLQGRCKFAPLLMQKICLHPLRCIIPPVRVHWCRWVFSGTNKSKRVQLCTQVMQGARLHPKGYCYCSIWGAKLHLFFLRAWDYSQCSSRHSRCFLSYFRYDSVRTFEEQSFSGDMYIILPN